MTKQYLYNELKRIQSIVWQDDDMMTQDTLFDVQERLADLTLKAANDIGKAEELAADFPWLYARR